MILIENRLCIIAEGDGFQLLTDCVTSCVTDDKVYGAVLTPLSIDEALALGRALVLAAEEAQAAKRAASRAQVDNALAAARAKHA